MAESILGGGTLIDIATAKRQAPVPARMRVADASATRVALEKQLSDHLGGTDKTYAALLQATKTEHEAAIGEKTARISHLQAETMAQAEARRVAEVALATEQESRRTLQAAIVDAGTRYTDLLARHDALTAQHAASSIQIIQARSDAAVAAKEATEARTALARATAEHAAAIERATKAAPTKTERKGYRLVVTARDGAGDIRDFKLIPD